jgi:hypothetical protein
VTTDISLPSPPTGTDTIDAIVEVDLGAGGRLLLPQTGDLQLPVPGTGVFAEATYNVLAVAQTSNGEDGPQSIRFDRGVDVESHSVSTFLPVPVNFETDGTLFSFEPVEGTQVTIFDIAESDGTRWWSVAVFDDSTEVELHEHLAFPSGTLSYRVQGFEAPDIDLEDFQIDAIEDLVTRISADVVEFTN